MGHSVSVGTNRRWIRVHNGARVVYGRFVRMRSVVILSLLMLVGLGALPGTADAELVPGPSFYVCVGWEVSTQTCIEFQMRLLTSTKDPAPEEWQTVVNGFAPSG